MKTVAVIPCCNEQETVAEVVSQSRRLVDLCIVADDNSDDRTAEVARLAGAYVVKHNGARGAGRNTKAGIDVALAMDADVVVTLDGDGQHNPLEIAKLLEPIEDGKADISVGSRFLSDGNNLMPRYRSFGIRVITLLYNVGNKDKLADAQCCFRAFRREVLRNMAIEESGFAFSTEMLVKTRALGYRITEVPVSVLYHEQFSQNSSLNPIMHGLSVAFGTVKQRVKIELLPRIKEVFPK